MTDRLLATGPAWRGRAAPLPLARLAATVVAAMGAIVLVGWWTHTPLFTSLVPGYVTMKPNTALALMLGAAALGISGTPRPSAPTSSPHSTWRGRAGIACALACTMIGLLTLYSYLVHAHWGFDQFLATVGARDSATATPGRMAAVTALTFVLLGGGLTALAMDDVRYERIAEGLLMTGLATPMGVLIGYLYHAIPVRGLGQGVQMAVHTALGCLALGVGAFAARPEWTTTRLFRFHTPGGLLIRRIVPAVVLGPLVLGALRLFAEQAGLVDPATGNALVTAAYMMLLAGVLRVTAVEIDRVQALHSVAEMARSAERARGDVAEELALELQDQQAELEVTNQQLQEHSEELAAKAEEMTSLAERLARRTEEAEASARRARFFGDVGTAIATRSPLDGTMKRCCEAAVEHLGAAFARVWVLDDTGTILVLRASAGQYTHLDGPHGRVKVGEYKIGRIAQDRRPHLTNQVVGDARVSDQEWALREGMVAFAGYPLLLGDELVGVFALFARQPLLDADFEAIATAAKAISVAVSNVRHFDAEHRAREAAEEANRAKTDFLAMMSHELRTPLNAIGGYAQLLELGVHGPLNDAQAEALGRIQRSERHLLGLIDDVLNFAKLEVGRVEYQIGDVAVCGAIDEVETLVAPQLQAKSLRFDRAECSHDLMARADADKLQQILVNLLSNAIKFTPDGGTVSMHCSRVAREVRIAVRDTGIGIAAERLEQVFAPFVQVGRRLNAPVEGTGLGLSISRELARAMDGDLTVESCPGSGSTFRLTLPAP